MTSREDLGIVIALERLLVLRTTSNRHISRLRRWCTNSSAGVDQREEQRRDDQSRRRGILVAMERAGAADGLEPAYLAGAPVVRTPPRGRTNGKNDDAMTSREDLGIVVALERAGAADNLEPAYLAAAPLVHELLRG